MIVCLFLSSCKGKISSIKYEEIVNEYNEEIKVLGKLEDDKDFEIENLTKKYEDQIQLLSDEKMTLVRELSSKLALIEERELAINQLEDEKYDLESSQIYKEDTKSIYFDNGYHVVLNIKYDFNHEIINIIGYIQEDKSEWSLKWEASMAQCDRHSFGIVSDDYILYIVIEEDLYAIDITNGTTVWIVEETGSMEGAPLINNGIIYYTDFFGASVTAISLSGNVIWESHPENCIGVYDIWIANDIIYLNSDEGVFTLDMNGQELD